MALVTSFDSPTACIITAISISMLAWFLRMVRSYAKIECGKEYIEAARISGASGMRIVFRHLVPNVLPQFVVYFTTGIASVIISISSFAFLGVGLVQGTAEWGAMLNDARGSIYTNPNLSFIRASVWLYAVPALICWGKDCVTPLGRRMESMLLEVKELTVSLAPAESEAWYRIRKLWAEASLQKGAFKSLGNLQMICYPIDKGKG